MKEYTLFALLAAGVTVLVDRLLRTRLLATRAFWIFLAVMYAFKLAANGYLTWRPIVLYDERFFLNIRLGTIPIEDFFYGFALIGLTVIFWEYFRRGESGFTFRGNADGMSIHLLRRTQMLPARPEEIFPFFERPENLSLLTPSWLKFTILTPSPVEMKSGAVIDYTISWLGVPMRWRTRISAYSPPMQFVDEQIRGPYSLWHHTHTFSAVEGGTRMVDEVRYALPGGPLGDLVHRLMVRKQLDRIFDFRAEAIVQVVGTRRAAVSSSAGPGNALQPQPGEAASAASGLLNPNLPADAHPADAGNR